MYACANGGEANANLPFTWGLGVPTWGCPLLYGRALTRHQPLPLPAPTPPEGESIAHVPKSGVTMHVSTVVAPT